MTNHSSRPAVLIWSFLSIAFLTVTCLIVYSQDTMLAPQALGTASALIGFVFPLIFLGLLGTAHTTVTSRALRISAYAIGFFTAVHLGLGDVSLYTADDIYQFLIAYTGSQYTFEVTLLSLLLMMFLTLAALLKCQWNPSATPDQKAQRDTIIATVILLLFAGILVTIRGETRDVYTLDWLNPGLILCSIVAPAYLLFVSHRFTVSYTRTFSAKLSASTVVGGFATIFWGDVLISQLVGRGYVYFDYVIWHFYPTLTFLSAVCCTVSLIVLLGNELRSDIPVNVALYERFMLFFSAGVFPYSRALTNIPYRWSASVVVLILWGIFMPLVILELAHRIKDRKWYKVIIFLGSAQMFYSLVILVNSDALTCAYSAFSTMPTVHTGFLLNASTALHMAVVAAVLMIMLLKALIRQAITEQGYLGRIVRIGKR
ncbi:hypothetical protein [Alloscardovia macacae]|uniref:Uncharacterized protein n=1 Tax=Alloscardovia macacae TaxID=1160091 RepID=A0A261F420_9BIFI|nr:hypothetical protein [Alloscardovia macacae]OZG53666.1 hypothetical protein ALMA_1231 [Alloscardovia macacae]